MSKRKGKSARKSAAKKEQTQEERNKFLESKPCFEDLKRTIQTSLSFQYGDYFDKKNMKLTGFSKQPQAKPEKVVQRVDSCQKQKDQLEQLFPNPKVSESRLLGTFTLPQKLCKVQVHNWARRMVAPPFLSSTIFYAITLEQSFDYQQKSFLKYSSIFEYVDDRLFQSIIDNVFLKYNDFYDEVKAYMSDSVKLNFYLIAAYIENYTRADRRQIKHPLGFLFEFAQEQNTYKQINAFHLKPSARKLMEQELQTNEENFWKNLLPSDNGGMNYYWGLIKETKAALGSEGFVEWENDYKEQLLAGMQKVQVSNPKLDQPTKKTARKPRGKKAQVLHEQSEEILQSQPTEDVKTSVQKETHLSTQIQRPTPPQTQLFNDRELRYQQENGDSNEPQFIGEEPASENQSKEAASNVVDQEPANLVDSKLDNEQLESEDPSDQPAVETIASHDEPVVQADTIQPQKKKKRVSGQDLVELLYSNPEKFKNKALNESCKMIHDYAMAFNKGQQKK